MSPERRPRVVEADAESVTLVLWTPSAEQFCVTVPVADIVALAGQEGWRSLLREMQIGPYVDLGRILMDGRVTASV
jgi:hypothetical protein